MAGKKIFLTFARRDGSDAHEFEWHVKENDLSELWFNELWKRLPDQERIREQNFWGFSRTKEDLVPYVDVLNDSIKIINDFYGERYHIKEKAFLGMSQDVLNALHHHFELLMGQSWNMSEYRHGCPPEVVKAVRLLNDYVHLYERAEAGIKNKQEGKKVVRVFQVQMVPYIQNELSLEHLKTFSYEVNFGDLVTNYCQLGKTWLEVCNDNDQDINLENITPLRFYAATFNCFFFTDTKVNSDWITDKVRTYIQERNKKDGWNVDPYDPRQALGHAVYASLAPDSPLKSWPTEKLDDFFNSHSNVVQIKLDSGNDQISRSFNDPDSYHY
jgi:hypothetical protein